jgi:serine/threonine protein kinase
MQNLPRIKDRYTIELPPIAKGGQAVICRATDIHLKNKILAVKCFNLGDPDAQQSAKTEGLILTSYNHQSIPKMFDEALVGTTYFVFMDFIEGETLAEKVRQKQLSDTIINDCITSIARILDYCNFHPEVPIVYGDLKPKNVIKSNDGRWVLLDFGSSVQIQQGQGMSRRQGTPGFASPELVAGMPVTPASDVYSLAALTLYLRTGQTPNQSLLNSLEHPLRKALDQDPQKRFCSAGEFVQALNSKKDVSGTKKVCCKACGHYFIENHLDCPRCQAKVDGQVLRISVTWELPPTKSNVTPLVNTRLYKALEKRQFVDASWKPLRDKAEKLLQFRGFEKLITINRLNIEPYDHQQKTSYKFLNDFYCNGILADEVGLGKTIEAGIIISELLERRLVKRVLIVVPNHLLFQWQEDMLEKIGLRFELFDTFNTRNSKLVIVPFYTFRQSNKSCYFENQGYDLVVLDEAHNLITSNGVSTGWYNLSSMQRKYTVLITATPIKRRITDLYHLVTLIRPGEFKNFYDFERLYIDPYNRQKTKNTNQLRQILSNLVIRNQRKTCAQNWPKKTSFSRVTEEHQKPKMLIDILNNNTEYLVLVFMSTSSLQYDICSFLRENVTAIGPRKVFYLTGDRNRKNEIIHKFRNSGNGVLIADRTSSEGRNLQFCHILVNYDIPRDPIEIEQRIGRVYRIGQNRDINIYNLASKNSLEEYLLDLYDKHLKLFSLWVGEIYDVIGHLERNETIPIKSKFLWDSYSHNIAEFKQKWNSYIDGIIKSQQEQEATDVQLSNIYDQLFG